MAHFAEIDSNNEVIRVLVVSNDDEHRGQEFLADDLGLGGFGYKQATTTILENSTPVSVTLTTKQPTFCNSATFCVVDFRR